MSRIENVRTFSTYRGDLVTADRVGAGMLLVVSTTDALQPVVVEMSEDDAIRLAHEIIRESR